MFLLVHKMDLVREDAQGVLGKKRAQLEQESAGLQVTVFGTSIYNESLYRVRHLLPHSDTELIDCSRRGLG